MREPCVFPASKLLAEAPPPEKKSKAEKTAACPERHGSKEEPPGIVVGYNFPAAAECPVCAERRAKKAAAQKRWRKKASE